MAEAMRYEQERGWLLKKPALLEWESVAHIDHYQLGARSIELAGQAQWRTRIRE